MLRVGRRRMVARKGRTRPQQATKMSTGTTTMLSSSCRKRPMIQLTTSVTIGPTQRTSASQMNLSLDHAQTGHGTDAP